jgi:CO dehydrogenase maturation factor
VIAIAGKGGTGKTLLAALLIRMLAKAQKLKVLAIDADSAVSLPYTLGVKVSKTIAEVREDVISDPEIRRQVLDQHIRSVIERLIIPGEGFDLLIMGRSEGPGCYCTLNDLLRYGIETTCKNYNVTIIDAEAGPEQVNRRVLQNVDTLIIVTDTSNRGFQTAKLIARVGDARAIRPYRSGLVINKVRETNQSLRDAATQAGLEVLGFIPEDENVITYDSIGKPIIELPETSPSVIAVRGILEKIGLAIS